jgi:DNA modification methylase
MGSGTTGIAAVIKGFDYIGFELSLENVEQAHKRIGKVSYQRCLEL